VQAQCSWQEGDARGKLRQQLQDLAACLEQQEQQQQQGGAGGSAAAAAGGAAGGSQGAAASAFFPAVAGAAGSPRSEQERRVQGQLAQLVGLPSAADVRGLLSGLEAADRLRLEGNAAVKAGRAAEAVQKYSEALGAAGLSPAIAAVLLSNRAAAHQHLKQRAQVRGGAELELDFLLCPAVAACCVAVAVHHAPHEQPKTEQCIKSIPPLLPCLPCSSLLPLPRAGHCRLLPLPLTNPSPACPAALNLLQAIADCCRSLALNPCFAKAHSRQATLLAELGYHENAAKALEAAAAAPGVSCAACAGGGSFSGRGRHNLHCLLIITAVNLKPLSNSELTSAPAACLRLRLCPATAPLPAGLRRRAPRVPAAADGGADGGAARGGARRGPLLPASCRPLSPAGTGAGHHPGGGGRPKSSSGACGGACSIFTALLAGR
jgi:hypothetical protein